MTYKLSPKQIERAVDRASGFLFDYCREHDKHYLVTGVSGGLDSAVVLGLAEQAQQMAERENFRLFSIGLIMPCVSDPQHAELGRQTIRRFAAEEIVIDLDEAFFLINERLNHDTNRKVEALLRRTEGLKERAAFAWGKRVAQGNIKARLRMLAGTYHVARLVDGLVLSTDNYSELLMGFWTINGDVGDLAPIQHFFKGLELYDIARFLNVPDAIIKALPTDGLGIVNGGDEAQLGADYKTVDKVMINLLQNGFDPDGSRLQLDNLAAIDGIADEVVYKLAERCLNAAYKRNGTGFPTREELRLPTINGMEI